MVEIHNNDLVNQIDHNAMVQRRELSPAQRSAENERDRQHMPEYKVHKAICLMLLYLYEFWFSMI